VKIREGETGDTNKNVEQRRQTKRDRRLASSDARSSEKSKDREQGRKRKKRKKRRREEEKKEKKTKKENKNKKKKIKNEPCRAPMFRWWPELDVSLAHLSSHPLSAGFLRFWGLLMEFSCSAAVP